MRRVAGDKHASMLQGRCRNDQVGVITRVTATATDYPKIRGTVEDCVRNWKNEGVLAEDSEARKLGRRVLIAITSNNLVPRHRGKGELAVELRIGQRLLLHCGVAQLMTSDTISVSKRAASMSYSKTRVRFAR